MSGRGGNIGNFINGNMSEDDIYRGQLINLLKNAAEMLGNPVKEFKFMSDDDLRQEVLDLLLITEGAWVQDAVDLLFRENEAFPLIPIYEAMEFIYGKLSSIHEERLGSRQANNTVFPEGSEMSELPPQNPIDVQQELEEEDLFQVQSVYQKIVLLGNHVVNSDREISSLPQIYEAVLELLNQYYSVLPSGLDKEILTDFISQFEACRNDPGSYLKWIQNGLRQLAEQFLQSIPANSTLRESKDGLVRWLEVVDWALSRDVLEQQQNSQLVHTDLMGDAVLEWEISQLWRVVKFVYEKADMDIADVPAATSNEFKDRLEEVRQAVVIVLVEKGIDANIFRLFHKTMNNDSLWETVDKMKQALLPVVQDLLSLSFQNYEDLLRSAEENERELELRIKSAYTVLQWVRLVTLKPIGLPYSLPKLNEEEALEEKLLKLLDGTVDVLKTMNSLLKAMKVFKECKTKLSRIECLEMILDKVIGGLVKQKVLMPLDIVLHYQILKEKVSNRSSETILNRAQVVKQEMLELFSTLGMSDAVQQLSVPMEKRELLEIMWSSLEFVLEMFNIPVITKPSDLDDEALLQEIKTNLTLAQETAQQFLQPVSEPTQHYPQAVSEKPGISDRMQQLKGLFESICLRVTGQNVNLRARNNRELLTEMAALLSDEKFTQQFNLELQEEKQILWEIHGINAQDDNALDANIKHVGNVLESLRALPDFQASTSAVNEAMPEQQVSNAELISAQRKNWQDTAGEKLEEKKSDTAPKPSGYFS